MRVVVTTELAEHEGEGAPHARLGAMAYGEREEQARQQRERLPVLVALQVVERLAMEPAEVGGGSHGYGDDGGRSAR